MIGLGFRRGQIVRLPGTNWYAEKPTPDCELAERQIASFREFLTWPLAAPEQRQGDGIVTLALGAQYATMVTAAAKMLRDTGCKLPLQIWHDGHVRGLDDPLTTLVDIRERWVQIPTRQHGGWESKTYAIINSGFKRALFLDADAYCVADPASAFTLLDSAPFVFWRDLHAGPHSVEWKSVGIDGSRVPPVQGGHFMVDTEAGWHFLKTADWLNQHSDYYYRFCGYGDQDCFRIALAACETPYRAIDDITWNGKVGAYICHFAGAPLVVHRITEKLWPNKALVWDAALPKEERMQQLFHEVRARPVYKPTRERIQLVHGCAPGDIVCLTALPRDIVARDPDRYEIHVSTHCPELWANNPYVTSYQQHPIAGARPIPLNYSSPMFYINNVRLHFITAFHRNFSDLEGLQVPCTAPKGDLYLSIHEEANRPVGARYWVIFPGGKQDFTTKVWSAQRWQQVVDKLVAKGLTVVQSGAVSPFHNNPKLKNVVDMVGKTNLRGILQLIYHAEGVISPVSFPMHAAAALDRPCVVIAGGREHWWWEAYVNVPKLPTFGDRSGPVKVPHRFLHTQDLLPCCAGRGCWKNKIESKTDKSVCEMPVNDDFGQIIPNCLKMISVDSVVDAAMSYYADGTLAAIT